MTTNIQQHAADIFDTPEKWRAFYDLQQACPDIINHWLYVGAKSLREEFRKNPGKWECAAWDGPRDTKWYLSELGERSISIGIGWETFELHLFDARASDETWQKATDLLEGRDFHQLVLRIGPRCFRPTWKAQKLLLADLDFDPLGLCTDTGFRSRFIAWHAAQRTEHFVEKTFGWLRQLMEDPQVVELILKLNNRSSTATNQ